MMGKRKSTGKLRRNLSQALVQKMTDSEERMAADHLRPGVTHDLPDSFSHLRLVTMDGTIGADGFVLAETAGYGPFLGISEQFIAIGAEITFPMEIPAENLDHLMEGLGFSLDASVHELPDKSRASLSRIMIIPFFPIP
jgi:hypothetical protein